MVLMFTDLVGSVSLKRRLGAADYARKLRRHDELFHQALAQVPHGRVLNDTGDGFLAGTDSPSDGVQVALAFQAALRAEDWGPVPFRARVGLHVGQVAEIEEGLTGGARSKIVGLAADLAARVMSLGHGDQILMTRPIFDDARQYVREHPPIPDGGRLELGWMAHGLYEMYGVDDPVDVFEVGAKGFAKLEAPTDSEKARRVVSREESELLGWRPAAGLEIPRRPGWIIEWKLGEGGFGDVWLAKNERTDERRVFKFCFDVDKLRSLKREMTMFRLIRKALGDRPDIARLHEVQLDSPPFFLESEFTEQGDMKIWAEKRGGIDKIGHATRIDLVARVAEAVAAAHSVGILHKDIKPSNILITLAKDGRPLPRLADFGIAALAEGASPAGDVTMEGFTESLDVAISGGTMMSGTRMYAPPETLAGKPFTLEGDVYALGVLLYQVTIGDLSRPLAPGWERDVEDDLLTEDIASAVDGDPRRRLKSAAELATRLGDLDVRRSQRAEAAAKAEREARRGRLLRLANIGLAGLVLICGTVFWALFREQGLRKESEEARFEAEKARGEAERERDRAKTAEELAAREAERARTEAAVADAVNAFLNEDLLGAVRPEDQGIDVSVRQVLEVASERIETKFEGQPAVEASIRTTLGRTYLSLGGFSDAEPHLLRAVELSDTETESERRRLARELLGVLYTLMGRFQEADQLLVEVLAERRATGADDRRTWSTLTAMGRLRTDQGKYAEAEALLEEALAGREKQLGPEDAETIASSQELAYLYQLWGRYDEALPIQRRVLEVCERVLRPEHPSTLSAQHSMTSLLLDMGRTRDAERRARDLLELRRRVLGPEHPRTLDTMNLLGTALFTLRQDAEVEAIWKETLEIRRRTLGDEHPNTISSVGNLASIYQARAHYDEAGDLYRSAVETSAAARGAEHPETLVAKQNLAEFYRSRGRYAEAEALFLEVIDGSKRVLGDQSPQLVAPMRNLGNLRSKQRNYGEAQQLLRDALALSRRTLGDEHPNTIQTLNDLGLVCVYAGEPAEARKLLDQALAARRRTLGDDHVDTATTLQNLASLEFRQRNLAKSIQLQEEVLAVREAAFGANHPLALSAKKNLADVNVAMGQAGIGAGLYRDTLDRSRRALGDDHPDTLRAFHSLAKLMRLDPRYRQDALKLAIQEYGLAKDRYGPNSSYAQRALDLIVDIMLKLEMFEEIEPWRALQVTGDEMSDGDVDLDG